MCNNQNTVLQGRQSCITVNCVCCSALYNLMAACFTNLQASVTLYCNIKISQPVQK